MTCVEEVHDVLTAMRKNFECPICLDLMKEPVTTRCDHIFCRFCMLQLLGKTKKGRAQCPMCKKEVTKRSLQDSPRFKLLVDGLLKLINAFELDSGYKFFPSQDYASTVTANRKGAPKKDEQPVVQSTGYRNRSKRGIVNGGHCDGNLSLLETSTDTPLTRDADTQNCNRQKKGTEQLITDFVSDSSEDDLFKKAGSLGSNPDEPYMPCESRVSCEPEEKEDGLMANEANDHISSKLESEDVAASDLAEYGFSEKDLESLRSNLLSIDGVRPLKESPSENSAVLRDPLLSDNDFCEKVAEQSKHVKLDENVRKSKRKEPNSNMPIDRPQCSESQTLKIAIDYQYDRDDSTPENMDSTQGTPRDVPSTVSREQVKKSIKKVNEWFLKTHEILNSCSSGDDELLPDISLVDNQDASDKGSHVSDETEIMAVSHCHVVADAVDKNMVSVEDKIFGRVYKREKKPNVASKVTCVADVHVDVHGVVEPLKVNEVPKITSAKPKRSTGLQPEDFIKKFKEKEQSADGIASGPVIVDDFGLDLESNPLKAANAIFLDADKIEVIAQDMETVSDAQLSEPKKQKRSLKRKSEKTQHTRMMQSLHLTTRTDEDLCQQQSPLHSSEVKIDSFSSSTEPGQEVNQKNVRRSKRLNLLKENDFSYSANQMATDTNNIDTRSGGPQIEGPTNGITTLNNCEDPGLLAAVSEEHGPQIANKSPIAVQNVTGKGNESSHVECDSVYVTEGTCKGSSPIPEQNAENTAELEDSDLDTQLLLKTFKSAKRMSFKLDPVTETADKENCDPLDISDVEASFRNGQQDKDQKSQTNEDILCASQSVQEKQPEPSRNLRSKKSSRLSSEKTVRTSTENTDNAPVHMTKIIRTDGQLNDLNPVKDFELLEECNQGKNAAVSKSEGPPLHLETESMCLHPVVTHQNPAAARRGDTKSGISQGENEQARNNSYQKCIFDEQQVSQMTSFNSSQGSMTGKLLGRSASHNSSPYKSPEVDSETPDGLLSGVDRLREDTSCCAVAEKSFVFGDGKKSKLVNRSVYPVNPSQVVRRRKRRAQKLESSEEESSGDEELPCFNALFASASNIADPKNASASSSPKQQGGGVLAMFSSCSTSGKTQTSFNLPREALVCSQESVNLFSSQSNTSDHSANGTTDRNGTRSQHQTRESSPKRAKVEEDCNEEMINEEEEMTNMETDHEDPCQENNLGEVSGCESEASHTGDSSGLSSQCEILNTQQRDAMRNNLEKLQREMAALEAVLEQHGSQSPASGRKQASTAEHVTIRPQEAQAEQADDGAYRSPDAIPETEDQSGQGRASGPQSGAQLPQFGSRSRSPTPPLSLPQATSRKDTPEKIRVSFNVFKELKESTLTEDESMGQKEDNDIHAHEPDYCAPAPTNQKNSKSPKRSLKGKLQAIKSHSTFRRGSTRQSTELKEIVQPPQHSSRHPGNTQRSTSPTFTSPLRSKVAPSVKSPVVSSKRNYSLVTSGLSQSEVNLGTSCTNLSGWNKNIDIYRILTFCLHAAYKYCLKEKILVQKFARKTQSIFSSQMTESTTHVIMKTDEEFVCERTLKYFLGIAGRKWVVSYEWIVQSFREGRILDEYDFEVKGDVINGRNHRGPRRSRLGSGGLLLTDFEICCLGSFKDLTRDDLEWILSLCGASVVHDPAQFDRKSGKTSLVVVQPDKETDYAAMRKKYRCLVITREWVLDSVSSYNLQVFDSYLV